MPYICETGIDKNCGDPIFWEIVKQKEMIIPDLIKKLDDTTTTEASVPNFGGFWTVADIAYAAMEEIIHRIPTFKLLNRKFDTGGCGYCEYWNYLRENYRNRDKFQTSLRIWYKNTKSKLAWVESNEFATCDCGGKHPNGGHFIVKQ